MMTQQLNFFSRAVPSPSARQTAALHSLGNGRSRARSRSISMSLMLSLLVGCQASSTEADKASGIADPTAPSILSDQTPSDEQQAKLLAAKDALFSKLSSRLMDAMSSAGPASAIEVCQVEAKSIAADVGQEMNVNIGRTGVRLRNTSNVAPAWAAPFIAKKQDIPLFVTLSNNQAAALLPIKLQAQCLMCHGPQETLAPDVQAKLTQLYPQDEAIGFAEGELRGWFWVESL
jgi:hypothetical protein